VYLRKIELLGFKSFPNKTTMKFSPGVTAVVGPNGCGKTNVLDALRWVLGEQRPTLMRGGKMDEVIFNGTNDMKALGMAEVTLTIVNNRGILPTEYHELQIGRRLFRSGESEYLLNRVPCRLKDITELFADTGMGAHSYSVIQQDMIDSVISDKAEERRFLFEEAAGITKYKQRRKAAMRKLDATENDFLRLRDIYAEVKTRVNSLYRQHKKAERYTKLSDEIKGWEIFLAARRMKKLENDKRELRAEFDALSDQRIQRESGLDQALAQLETDRKEQIDVERKLTEIGNTIYAINEEAHDAERQISVLKEKKSNAQQLIEKNRVDLGAFGERTGQLTEQRKAADAQMETHRQELDSVKKQLAEAQHVQAEADQHLMRARLTKEEENKRLLDLEGKISSGRAEKDNLEEQDREYTESVDNLNAQIEDEKPRQRELLSQIETHRNLLDEASAKKTALEARQRQLTTEMEQLVETGEELTLELSNLAASVEACQARRNLLEEMMLQYEGYESGVLTAMDQRERWPGLVGTVAEVVVPSDGMEAALEAALGEMARFIVCEDRATAVDIITHLRAEKKGRIGILVPDTGIINPVVKRPEIDLPGVVGWLDRFVTSGDSHRPLMEAVLARTVVFHAGTNPDAILERLPYGFSAVSTDGILYRKNLVAGGSDDAFPLFRRKEKVAEQEQEIQQLQKRIDTVRERKNRTSVRLGAVRAESGQVSSDLETIAEELVSIQAKLGEAEFENRSLTAEFERLEREKQQLHSRLERIRDRQCSLGLDFTTLTNQKESLVNSMNQVGSRLEDVEREAVAAAERVAKLQVAVIEARSRVEQVESQIAYIADVMAEIEHRHNTKTSEIEQAERDIAGAESTLTSLEISLKESFEKRESHVVRQKEMRAVQTSIMERVDEREKEAKQLRQQKDGVAEKLHQAEIRLTSMDSEIGSLSEKLRDEYEVDLTNVVLERPDDNITDEQAPAHLAEIKDKLRSFGAVNLLALEEYEVASEREKFLSEQLADLTSAKNDLKATINKINHTAKQLFTETMDKVRDNLRKLFVELFNGGEADIRLEDPDDPLESNIEIIARPGGKKLLPITMLSGGERALTAISLLFSLYLVKPSPFCILDEIDAPLDDANCHRFLKLIHSFSAQTQFITITHNKITMEAADNLYGVTMEQPGVSTLVSVRFRESGDADQAELDIATPEETGSEPLPEPVKERITPVVSITNKTDSSSQ